MRNKKGFTLIELLVVIAIIAILAAILFPVFANTKERSRQNKCLNNMKQLGMAILQYADDHSGMTPIGSATIMKNQTGIQYYDWTGSPAVGSPITPSNGGLWIYYRSTKLLACPTDERMPHPGVQFPQAPGSYPLSYSMNSMLDRLKFDASTAGKSSKILLIHEDRKSINDGYFVWAGGTDIPDKVHYNGTTAIYADLHAKWYLIDELNRQWKANEWVPNPS